MLKRDPSKVASWPQNRENVQLYFHLHTLDGGCINIKISQYMYTNSLQFLLQIYAPQGKAVLACSSAMKNRKWLVHNVTHTSTTHDSYFMMSHTKTARHKKEALRPSVVFCLFVCRFVFSLKRLWHWVCNATWDCMRTEGRMPPPKPGFEPTTWPSQVKCLSHMVTLLPLIE